VQLTGDAEFNEIYFTDVRDFVSPDLYKQRAVDAAVNVSDPSNSASATVVTFTCARNGNATAVAHAIANSAPP
jgi:hypothetical protein